MYDSIYPPDYYILEHHGILGQKWGVRRYQNSDGSLTPAGRSRYITTNKHAIDWATYKIGSDKAESKMGRHATLRSMTNLNMRRQAAREVGEGLSARDKASGMYRVYNRRKIANGVAAGLGVVGTAAGIAANPAAGVALGVRTGLATARGHYNQYKAEIAASGHTENLENVHAAQLVDMYNKTTGRKQSSVVRALDIGAVGIGRFDSRHPVVGVVATAAATAAVGAAVASAGNTGLNSIMGGNNSTTTYTPMFGSNAGKKHTTFTVSPSVSTPPAYVNNPYSKNQSPFSTNIYTYGKNPYGSR